MRDEFLLSSTLSPLLAAPKKALIHRDLSWVQFNERVLDEAKTSSGNPLLERLKFLAISSSNLDEFFMIRLASMARHLSALRRHRSGKVQQIRRLVEIRYFILDRIKRVALRQGDVLDELIHELVRAGIHLVRNTRINDPAHALGRALFEQHLLPKLGAPEAFRAKKLSSLENLQSAIILPGGEWIKVPKGLPPIVGNSPDPSALPYFFFTDHLLANHLVGALQKKGTALMVRLTRDCDLPYDMEDEDPESIPDVVRFQLGTREKGKVVRLQYLGSLPPHFLSQAMRLLNLAPGQIYSIPGTLNLHGLWTVVNQIPGEQVEPLRYPMLKPRVPRIFRAKENLFEKIKDEDILLHHPYDSFDAFVSWIGGACEDPNVETIEQTIYRMDHLSPVLELLKGAAKRKKIRVLIELRARFDESNNLCLMDELEANGVEVAFGFTRLKLHAKITLITRKEGEERRLYTHLSTGNYNSTTARQYTDLALITANQEIGNDARHFFDAIWKGQIPQGLKHLVVAPTRLHRRLLAHIAEETEAATLRKPARIVAKVNALVDESVIKQLYRASQAGVKVDLIVRGACSLIPGVKGLSENVRVISVVDRFLEHSRLYYFGSSRVLYLSSADCMPRNFFSRLEIAFPILDQKIFSFLETVVIPTYLSDNVKARELTSHGVWKKRPLEDSQPSVRSQFVFDELTRHEE